MKHSILFAVALALGLPDSSLAQNDGAVPAADSGNPEMSLILQGRYFNADVDTHIAGYLPAGHQHGPERGFTLDHSELNLSGSIDPSFRGHAVFAFADDEVEIEEAWVQTTAIGGGFTFKLGRYLSSIGYANEIHPHAWDFANQNLVYTATLGEHQIHDGAQLKWVAPTPMFLEFGVEAGQGADWVDRSNMGSHAAYVHTGSDIGENLAWRAGLSYLRVRADGREGDVRDDNDVDSEVAFTGKSEYWIFDYVFKWAPDGNARERNWKIQGEFIRRYEVGDLTCDDNTASAGACGGITDTYYARQTGWYVQGVYQFHPQWRAGYRYDRLGFGELRYGPSYSGVFSKPAFTSRRNTVMIDYNPSEFSRLRVQYSRSETQPDKNDDQIALQYIHSLGKHGAHRF